MLNLERLRALDALARHGSVVAASAELHVTPSAISQQLAKLEREVGQPLIERRGRGVRLTPAADLLAARAGEILSLVVRAQSPAQDRGGEHPGRLVIGAFPSAVGDLALPVVRMLQAVRPGLLPAVHEIEYAQAVVAILVGELDLAVVQEWTGSGLPRPAELFLTALLDDPVELAVPMSSPLAQRADVELTDLPALDWVAPPAGTAGGDWLRRSVLRDRGGPRIDNPAADPANQMALVAAGLGVAAVPRLGRVIHPGVVFVPMRPAVRRSVLLAGRRDAADRPVIGAAVAGFESAARRMEAVARTETTIDLRSPGRTGQEPVPRPR